MAWRRLSDKPLSEPMMAYFTDAYMRHSASMSYINLELVFEQLKNADLMSL